LQQFDLTLFHLINGHHSPLMDQVMWYTSTKFLWVPVYLYMLISLGKKYRGTAFFYLLICIGLCVLASDQIASGLFKNWVQRIRPSHEPSLEGIVQLVKEPNGDLYRGGQFGFYSSHASNMFAAVTLFFVLMRPQPKWIFTALFAWAMWVSVSRIYLGVHYPTDVLMGIFMGILIGWGCATMYLRLYQKGKLTQ
jgi:undecaprenyl-diphosphatase